MRYHGTARFKFHYNSNKPPNSSSYINSLLWSQFKNCFYFLVHLFSFSFLTAFIKPRTTMTKSTWSQQSQFSFTGNSVDNGWRGKTQGISRHFKRFSEKRLQPIWKFHSSLWNAPILWGITMSSNGPGHTCGWGGMDIITLSPSEHHLPKHCKKNKTGSR